MADDPRHKAVDSIIADLDRMPRWAFLSPVSQAGEMEAAVYTARHIETTMERIAARDLDTIRAAIAVYHERALAKNPADEVKLLILNKYLFALPRTVRRDSKQLRHFLTGWSGMPTTGDPDNPRPSDEFFVRWPWTEGPDGMWYFMPTSGFTYMGPPYGALKMFDYFRKEFGKRQRKKSTQTIPERQSRPTSAAR